MKGLYRALIQTAGPSDLHHQVSVEAENFEEAKRLLEVRFGRGTVVSIEGERESKRLR